MSGYDLSAIKASVNIGDIVGQAVQLKKNGKGMVGLCPFHPDRSPSLHVFDDHYHCFACGAHGDVIDFVQNMKRCDLATAVSMLVGNGGAIDTSPEAKAEIARMAAQRDKKVAEDRAAAIARARRIWDEAEDRLADPHHPYLVRKQVEAAGVRQANDGRLLLPVYDGDGDIMSVQYISDNGTKMFLAGAPTKGGSMPIGVNFKKIVIVCEGFATGATLFSSTLYHVRVAFSLGNMEHVARRLTENGVAIVLAADIGKSAEQMAKLAKELKCPFAIPRDDIVLDGGEVGSDFNDQSVAFGSESVAADIGAVIDAFVLAQTRKEAEAKADNGPIDLWSKPEPPPFPLGVFPQVIESLAVARAGQVGCDPAGIAVAAIVACGAAISDDIKLKVNRNEPWTERACMWAMLIGTPSTNKSAIIRAATDKIKEIDRHMLYENNRVLAQWQEDGGTKGPNPKPATPRLRIEDTTMEAAQEVCKDSPRGVLSIQDELEGFFGGISKYAGEKGGARDRTFWISAYNGGSYTVNRIGRGGPGGFIIDNLSMSMIGGIQPDPIKRIMSGLSDNGLIQRFMPIVLRDGRFGEDVAIPPVVDDFGNLVEALHAIKIERKGAFFFNDNIVFDDDAQEVQYRTSRFHFERMKSLESINPLLSTHMGKFNGFFARLCLIWHCIENAENPDGLPQRITLQTAERVEHFLHKFLLPHSVAFFVGMLGMAMDHDKIVAVAGYILAHKLETVTMRTIGQNVRAMKRVDRAEASIIFEQLEAMGWLEQANKRSDAPSWNVNPQVHEMFEARAADEAERRADSRRLIAEMIESGRAGHGE